MTAPDQSRPNPDVEYVDMKYIDANDYKLSGYKRNDKGDRVYKLYFRWNCYKCNEPMTINKDGKDYCDPCDSYHKKISTKRVRMWDSE